MIEKEELERFIASCKDGRACPAGGAGGGLREIAAGGKQTAAGGFALKLHGDFYQQMQGLFL